MGTLSETTAQPANLPVRIGSRSSMSRPGGCPAYMKGIGPSDERPKQADHRNCQHMTEYAFCNAGLRDPQAYVNRRCAAAGVTRWSSTRQPSPTVSRRAPRE